MLFDSDCVTIPQTVVCSKCGQDQQFEPVELAQIEGWTGLESDSIISLDHWTGCCPACCLTDFF